MGLMFASASAQAANLIMDGDFNNTNATFVDVASVSTIGPWHVTSGSVDLIGGYWQSPSGPNASAGGTNGSIDLNGSGPGTISQSFTTQVGKEYALTFDLSGNPDGGPATKMVKVVVGPAGAVDTFPAVLEALSSHSNMNYLPEELDFTATGTTTTLKFEGDNISSYGAVIGDVVVTPVPEPAAWATLLLGVGVIGAGLRMARQVQAPARRYS
jgi:choice-of-anchor C domain-containing protein